MVIHRFIAGVLLLAGCRPEFEDRSSEVRRLRVLAVRSTPAEAPPGATVRYDALVVDPLGSVLPPLDWAYCSKPRPLDEPNAISIACFRREAEWITPIGATASVETALPSNGCRQFGSDIPEPKLGEPPGRPADPDTTGGYYQPLRLLVEADPRPVLALGQTRLICGLPNATREVTEVFRRRYHPNRNPQILSVESGGRALAAEGEPPAVTVAPNARIALRVIWPSCDDAGGCGDGLCSIEEDLTSCPADCAPPAKTCAGAETYLYYDLASRTLVPRRESIRVSWFATAGELAEERTGRDENDRATFADNIFTAPSAVGPVKVWVVVRDSRGGVDFRALRLDVQ